MKYQDHCTTSEAMNQNIEANCETMQSCKFIGHERKQWKQAESNTAKLQENVFYVYGSVHHNIFYEINNRCSYMQSILFHC